MATPEKKSDLQPIELTANQKISKALLQVNQALKFNESIGGGALRKAQRHFVEYRQDIGGKRNKHQDVAMGSLQTNQTIHGHTAERWCGA
jgi:hypothetical protein